MIRVKGQKFLEHPAVARLPKSTTGFMRAVAFFAQCGHGPFPPPVKVPPTLRGVPKQRRQLVREIGDVCRLALELRVVLLNHGVDYSNAWRLVRIGKRSEDDLRAMVANAHARTQALRKRIIEQFAVEDALARTGDREAGAFGEPYVESVQRLLVELQPAQDWLNRQHASRTRGELGTAVPFRSVTRKAQ